MANTIAAIATGMGNAGIGIIRISGENAIAVADQIYKPKNNKKRIMQMQSYTAGYGSIVDGEHIIDEVIVLVMKAPHTYTKEDVVEIDCHGGIVSMKRILNLIIRNGARIAMPGEFTKRAFLNGRIDLSQAESVMELIHAKNEMALKSSVSQLRGDLKDTIKNLRKDILYYLAYIESALDDPENYSLEGFRDTLGNVVYDVKKEVETLLTSSDNGRIIKEGIKTVIVGKPNAGKSSVLNVLLGEERAIVTDIAGTTRDTLEESIHVNGIPLNIVDTAGIRNTDNIVEKIGVDKTYQLIQDADLILYVVDDSVPLDQNDEQIINKIKGKKVIVLFNKSDLEGVVDKLWINEHLDKNTVDISAKQNQGFQDLYEMLNQMFFEGLLSYNDEIYITNMRHKDALLRTKESLNQVLLSIADGMSEDFYTIDLMAAYEELGYIIGEAVEDDLVNEIFKEFCVGK